MHPASYWVEFKPDTGLSDECYESLAESASAAISEANARFRDSKLIALTKHNVILTRLPPMR